MYFPQVTLFKFGANILFLMKINNVPLKMVQNANIQKMAM